MKAYKYAIISRSIQVTFIVSYLALTEPLPQPVLFVPQLPSPLDRRTLLPMDIPGLRTTAFQIESKNIV